MKKGEYIMKRWNISLLIGGIMLSASTLAWSEGWEHESHEHASRIQQSQAAMHPTARKDYRNECASCHMLYPANLLPTRSWKHIMSSLEHHFGENAELDQEDTQRITSYLVQHSSDEDRNYFGNRINRSIPKNRATMRISQTRYFLRKHDEIPQRFVSGNKKVGSFSNCIACHHGAEHGSFDEDDVIIPGMRRWED